MSPSVGRSFPCERPVGLCRNLSHRSGENGCVPLPALAAPSLRTDGKDVGEIDLRGASEANRAIRLARVLRRGRRQSLEVAFEIGVIDLGEIAAFERIGAGLDLRAERFQSETVFSSSLLKDA